MYKILDLFAGAGGLSLGFEMTEQFEVVAIVENNANAAKTYMKNHPGLKNYDDIMKVDFDKIIEENGKVDVVIGGPPCQGFSNAGKRIIDDPRNRMFVEFIKAIEILQPKIVIMENVQGFLTLDNGSFLNQTKEMLSNLGYVCEAKLLNTVNYGVPQKRKRVIIIAIESSYLGNHLIDDVFPIPDTSVEINHITAYDAIFDLENIQPNTIAKYSSKTNFYLEKIKY